MYMLYMGEGAHIVLGGGPCVVHDDVYGGPHVVYGQSQFFVWGTMVCIRGHRHPLDASSLCIPQLIDFIS